MLILQNIKNNSKLKPLPPWFLFLQFVVKAKKQSQASIDNATLYTTYGKMIHDPSLLGLAMVYFVNPTMVEEVDWNRRFSKEINKNYGGFRSMTELIGTN